MDGSFAWFLALKPALIALFLGAYAWFLWLLWRYLPRGRVRRLVFFKLWGAESAWPPGRSFFSRLLWPRAGESAPQEPPSPRESGPGQWFRP